MKTSELTGAALDWAVAKCEGVSVRNGFDDNCPEYSTDWAQGGPIIERERLSVSPYSFNNANPWVSHSAEGNKTIVGPTPLITVMRCYVASKLGNEVDVPKELTP